MKIVKQIISEVKENGDEAVRKYTGIFDKIRPENFEVSRLEIKSAYKEVDQDFIETIRKAAINIELFARKQMRQFENFEYRKNGVTLGQKIIPIENIGVYVPGGNYPLISTALMCIIPAKIAGVKNIVVCSPRIKPETIVAADFAGADRIFNIGGAQAIAALAYGTETIPKVDKIVGPGNIYVTSAKKEVYGKVGIDFLAGPSEVLIIADEYANPKIIAADLLAQAEHDVNSKLILITNSEKIIRDTERELKIQLKKLKTKDIAAEALKNKRMIKVKSLRKALELSNEIAPEHVELQIKNPRKYLNRLKNYGSLFLGEYSDVAFGDYSSGTNHVLPTGSAAKYTGGLSVNDFIKIQTYQYINKEGAKDLGKITAKFASLEGLDAHRKSVEIRLKEGD
ncbi:MAG: histidinol dehydrogenase [Candidatus Aenigmarchaeota archaeon]